MRLRPLTEAECYARCYGAVRSEQVSVLRLVPQRVAPAPERVERRTTQAKEAA